MSDFWQHVLLIFLSVSLHKHVLLRITSLAKVLLNLVNVFPVKLSKELYDGSHVFIFKSRHLGQEFIVIFRRLYLHKVLLNLIDSSIIKV